MVRFEVSMQNHYFMDKISPKLVRFILQICNSKLRKHLIWVHTFSLYTLGGKKFILMVILLFIIVIICHAMSLLLYMLYVNEISCDSVTCYFVTCHAMSHGLSYHEIFSSIGVYYFYHDPKCKDEELS